MSDDKCTCATYPDDGCPAEKDCHFDSVRGAVLPFSFRPEQVWIRGRDNPVCPHCGDEDRDFMTDAWADGDSCYDGDGDLWGGIVCKSCGKEMVVHIYRRYTFDTVRKYT